VSKLLKNSQQTHNVPTRYDPLCPQWQVTATCSPCCTLECLKACITTWRMVHPCGGSSNKFASHWGQGGTYPGGTLRIHWGFLSNLSTHYLGDTCWTLLKCTPHFDHNVTCDHMLVTFKMSPPKYPLGTFWMKTLGSFTILFAMCPPWARATHWGFFQKMPCNVITMYPATTLWALWGFVLKLNHIEVSLWLLWKEPPGDIVVTFQGTFWKKS